MPDHSNETSYREHPEGVTPYYSPYSPQDTPAGYIATGTPDARALELPPHDTFTHKLAFVLSILLIALTVYHLGGVAIDYAVEVYRTVSNSAS